MKRPLLISALSKAGACACSLALIAGCASSGVVPSGDGAYPVSKKSIGCGFASAESVKADLYKEANEFCAAQKKEVHTVAVTANDGVPFVRCANAELHFTCADRPKNSQ